MSKIYETKSLPEDVCSKQSNRKIYFVLFSSDLHKLFESFYQEKKSSKKSKKEALNLHYMTGTGNQFVNLIEYIFAAGI